MERTQAAEPEPRATAGAPPDRAAILERLVRQHRELDARLTELSLRPALSPTEEFERAVMKKRKLALKDRIAVLSASS